MASLDEAYRLKGAGRFSDALVALAEAKATLATGHAPEVLRAELLEAIGQRTRAMTIAVSLLKSKQLRLVDKSACEFIVGKILVDEGDISEGMQHLQRSASCARDAKSDDRLFTAQLKLMSLVSERSGPGAATALFAEARHLAIKLGDPHVTAQLHLFVAEMEAKRGLLDNARRHSAIARRLLAASPNAYLEAFCSNLELAICVLLSQFDVAEASGDMAAKSANQSGVAKLRRAVLNNMASLFCETGQFERATEYFEKALTASELYGTHAWAIHDGMARVHLLQGRLDECAELLDRIECTIQNEDKRTLYGYRYAALTRAQLLARQGRIDDAIGMTSSVSSLATASGDTLLQSRADLVRAALLLRAGRTHESLEILQAVEPRLVNASPEVYAHAEGVLACALIREGKRAAGQTHRDRATRIYRAIGHVTGQIELQCAWDEAELATTHSSADPTFVAGLGARCPRAENQTLHDLASAMVHGAHPEIVALDFVETLKRSDCVFSARVISRASNKSEQTISTSSSEKGASIDVVEERLPIGFHNGRTIELAFRPKNDVESVASLKAIRLLVTSIQEISRGRAEKEREARLWPLDDDYKSENGAVISGKMQQLMENARRIARAKVNVLITGESGTGKEILARAIHDFSDRDHKPFVPFNCAAIPRDLLESQLFGHRRGAFTGADRDQLGYIRAARGGTLFLDEIGELGLDLQPKLLRFLESGEISPLGEPNAMTIDVRIVAATNSKLEEAVRAGRFREDLFYRLNVVRLDIPPLRERRDEIPGFVNHFAARAAEEFKKGQLRIAEETMEHLLLYRWPGNVRQLKNEMDRMVALAEADSTLLPESISDHILEALPVLRHPSTSGEAITVDLNEKLVPAVARLEAEMIRAALKRHGGKVDAVAKALGISRKGLYLKRQRLGL
jgi:transcriptional regulator with PAS, ATPase and Fis domain/tetratricopeptide (TPR) repeat protein